MEAAKQCSDYPNAVGNRTDKLNIGMDVHIIGNSTKTTEKEAEIVRTQRNELKMQNSPHTSKIGMLERTARWRQAEAGTVQ